MWILNTAVAFFHIYWTCASVEYTSDISNVKPVKKKKYMFRFWNLVNVNLCVAVPFLSHTQSIKLMYDIQAVISWHIWDLKDILKD